MTLEELKRLLYEHCIDHEMWPRLECGTLEDLHEEIQRRECIIVIQDDRPIRLIRVSSILVYAFAHNSNLGIHGNSWLVLREDRHELPSGRFIDRGHLPNSVSEKLRNGETAEQAAHRALASELGWVDPMSYRIHRNYAMDNKQDCVAAHRYFGLKTVVTEKTVWKCLITDKRLYDPNGYQVKVGGKTLHFHWELLLHPPSLIFPDEDGHRTGSD